MEDLLKGIDAVPTVDNVEPNPPKAPVNIPEAPFIRFPPFPPVPDGVKIISLKQFKECGIQIFSAGDVEIDGLGIPTVPLRVYHDTDKSKTNAKKVKKDEDEKESKKKKVKKGPPPTEKLDPIARAQEQKRQRLLLFAKKEWYEQWAEGEDLRGTRTYDPNLSPIDRIHMAATEFRTGRIWPPGYMKVNYLWDQFRLYAGLLGSPPVWIRTDLPQPEEDGDDFDDETDSDVELSKIKKEKEKLARKPKDSDEDDDDDFLYSDEDEDDIQSPRRQKDRGEVGKDPHAPAQTKFKRIPPRTPYALYNIVPIPISSDAEVRKLLAISTARRESRLLKFLADPERSVRVFLTWYLRHESLIWSPNYLVSFPHIVQFFLSFLVRVKALPESERGLKKAVEVAKRGIVELGRTGKLCRELPDRFGAGLTAIYGKRWEEDQWNIDMFEGGGKDKNLLPGEGDDHDAEVNNETKEEALKRFEEELRAANVQILPADPIDLGIPTADLVEEEEEVAGKMGDTALDSFIQTSPLVEVVNGHDTSSGLQEVEDDTITGTILLPPTEKDQKENSKEVSNDDTTQQTTLLATDTSTVAQIDTKFSDTETSVDDLDWSKPDGKINAVEKQAAKEAWEPSKVQPLMEIFGMTTLPLKFDAGGHGGPNKFGVAERSMRRVKAIFKPGEAEKDRKWRGIEDDLVKRLSRVVLAPWLDWENGGIEIDYRSHKVQGDNLPQTTEDGEQQEQVKYAARYAHDPEKDDITLLIEPHVADLVTVGMGMAGTFIQLVPARDDRPRTHGDQGRGRGRGGGGGGYTPGSAAMPLKEFTFWYVEHLQLAVPSFWTAGEEEKPITREDVDEALELDLEV